MSPWISVISTLLRAAIGVDEDDDNDAMDRDRSQISASGLSDDLAQYQASTGAGLHLNGGLFEALQNVSQRTTLVSACS